MHTNENYQCNVNSDIKIHFDILNIDKTSRVEGEDQEYKLLVGGYRGGGGAGNSLTGDDPANGMKFSTRDRDNDNHGGSHCIDTYKGAWWFNV